MRHNKLISALMAVALVFAFAISAWAVTASNTAANTEIVNTATVSYTNQANTSFSVSATVKTTVTEVIATPTVTPANLTVAPGQRVANTSVIANNSNWVSQFDISAVVPTISASSMGAVAPTIVGAYVNPIAQATSTTFVGVGTAIQLAASGAGYVTPYINSINNASATANASAAAVLAALTYTPASGTVANGGAGVYPNNTVVFFVYDIPANASSGGTLTKTISVNATKDSTKIVNNVQMVDTVAAPTLTVTKGVANIGNASTAAYAGAYATTTTGVPGDTLEYQVVITNTGTASATAVALADAIDVNTTLLGYTTGAAAAAVNATVINSTYSVPAGTNTTTYTGSTVTSLALQLTDSALVGATAGSVDPGAVITLKYRVVIK